MVTQYTAIVKGDADDAKAKCEEMGLTVVSHTYQEKFNSTVCVVEGNPEMLYSWFNEGGHYEAPYPPGTLLWFGPREDATRDGTRGE